MTSERSARPHVGVGGVLGPARLAGHSDPVIGLKPRAAYKPREHLADSMAEQLLAANANKGAERVVDVRVAEIDDLAAIITNRGDHHKGVEHRLDRGVEALLAGVQLRLNGPASLLTLHRLQREGKVGRHPVEQHDFCLVEEPRLRGVSRQHRHATIVHHEREPGRRSKPPRERRVAPRGHPLVRRDVRREHVMALARGDAGRPPALRNVEHGDPEVIEVALHRARVGDGDDPPAIVDLTHPRHPQPPLLDQHAADLLEEGKPLPDPHDRLV